MRGDVDTKDAAAVCAESDRIYRSMYPDADPGFLPWARDSFLAIFGGRYGDYLPVDVPYHDREHTMQGLLCLVRLLHGRQKADARPVVPRRTFELGVMAILLHDSGYLKHADDTEGTGAKYTLVHVDRGRAFAEAFLQDQGFTRAEIEAVQNMIRGTSMSATPADTPFANDVERTVGAALATADLIGQMSADDYVERLPQLYGEFVESIRYFGEEKAGRLSYESAAAMIANTPHFWQSYVKPKLENGCQGMYRYLNDPYPDGDNEYLNRIEANVEKAARTARATAAASVRS
ncbi:MAG: hypothetical protein U5R46_16395 [Gammaproteobacteria bacterium]|nr:hypothetical protein [Gammaproteobacteria bacterium]